MTTLKKISTTFICLLVIYYFISLLFGGETHFILKSGRIWVLSVFFLLINLAVNSIIRNVASEANRDQYYRIATITVLILFAGINFSVHYTNWKHKRDFGNIESNHDYFENWLGTHEYEAKLAFDTLISRFPNPNDIRISSSSVIPKIDSSIHLIDTAYYIKFNYSKYKDTQLFKSESIVFRNNAKVLYFDISLTDHDLYKIDSLQSFAIKQLEEALQVLPDSMRNKLENEFKEILDK